jgi:hypothetical protein
VARGSRLRRSHRPGQAARDIADGAIRAGPPQGNAGRAGGHQPYAQGCPIAAHRPGRVRRWRSVRVTRTADPVAAVADPLLAPIHSKCTGPGRGLVPIGTACVGWCGRDTHGQLIGRYPNLALILIWVTLVGAAWVLPSEPRPQILTAQRAWVRNLPSGIAAVHRLIIARSQTDLKAPTIRCRASEVAAFHCTSAPVQRPARIPLALSIAGCAPRQCFCSHAHFIDLQNPERSRKRMAPQACPIPARDWQGPIGGGSA